MRIVMIPSDMDAPGSYRCLFPGRQLALKGHRVSMPPREDILWEDGSYKVIFDERELIKNPETDIVVLQQRKERCWAQGATTELRAKGVVVVSECDDNYLELPDYNPAALGTNPHRRSDGTVITVKERKFALRNPERYVKRLNLSPEASRVLTRELKRGRFPKNKLNRDYMHETFSQSDAMTVSTPYLKDLYSKLNPEITVIRNYLDWEMWEDVVPVYEREWSRTRIGYMGVFKYRRADLAVIRDVVGEFLLEHPDVDFVANSQEVHNFLDVPQEQRVTYPEIPFWKKDGTYDLPQITAVMDIGLVPLKMNGLNQAKSHLKGMEYNACGIPFIASPTESYEEYWCDGRNGFLAHSPLEWKKHLEALLDPGLRLQMGTYARDKAARHTIQRNVQEWEDFYRRLLGDSADALARKSLRLGAIQKVSELAPLLRLVRSARPEVVVEIGSAHGGTFKAFCEVAAEDALLVSIDLPFGDFDKADESYKRTGRDRYGRTDTPVATMRSYLKPGQQGEFLRMDSQAPETRETLERILDGRRIDFLFIDGDHSYQGVKKDFQQYKELADLIAFHDILPHPRAPESQVHTVWDEIKSEYDYEEFCTPGETRGWGQWGGIGVLYMERERKAVAA